ncbi:hypothetical protein niasHT_036870 [Heterodera trifolii]|uniref:Uncharacterized protein n=1 Tax=Heterodera trifolii TaxID=157864 RepID=A0ABD2IHC9_9BILA
MPPVCKCKVCDECRRKQRLYEISERKKIIASCNGDHHYIEMIELRMRDLKLYKRAYRRIKSVIDQVVEGPFHVKCTSKCQEEFTYYLIKWECCTEDFGWGVGCTYAEISDISQNELLAYYDRERVLGEIDAPLAMDGIIAQLRGKNLGENDDLIGAGEEAAGQDAAVKKRARRKNKKRGGKRVKKGIEEEEEEEAEDEGEEEEEAEEEGEEEEANDSVVGSSIWSGSIDSAITGFSTMSATQRKKVLGRSRQWWQERKDRKKTEKGRCAKTAGAPENAKLNFD